MKSPLVWFCVIGFALTAHAQSPIDGKWEAQFTDSQGQPTLVVFDLKSNGDTLAGTITSWRGSEQLHQIAVQDGKIHGHSVQFGTSYIVPFLHNRFGLRELGKLLRNWGAPINAITGTLTEDGIRFSQLDWRSDTTDFEAKRKR